MKEKTKIILVVIISIVSTLSITAFAVFRASANNITFSSDKTEKDNVEESLNELYEMTEKCSNGKIYTGDFGVIDNSKKCRRAKTLHTEICSQTIETQYCSATNSNNGKDIQINSNIVYGNSCVTKNVLHTGDAFTCDVNGDGIYNEETERFYYVSDLYTGGETGSETFDTNYAVLIYYNNTTNGEPDNTSASLIAYNSANVNNLGPVTAVANLPSTTQWSNVSLKNQTRQIRTEMGSTGASDGTIYPYTYTDKAARLITAQEINKACSIIVGSKTTGELDTTICRFLLENTKYSNNAMTYGYWLETPLAFRANFVWRIDGYTRAVYSHLAYDTIDFGVRPVIEVLKIDIAY